MFLFKYHVSIWVPDPPFLTLWRNTWMLPYRRLNRGPNQRKSTSLVGLWVEGGPILQTWTLGIFKESEMEPSAAIKSLQMYMFQELYTKILPWGEMDKISRRKCQRNILTIDWAAKLKLKICQQLWKKVRSTTKRRIVGMVSILYGSLYFLIHLNLP